MARKKSVPDMFDVVIAGGGYVGLSLAVALKQGDAGLTCAVVDPKPMEDLHKDPRASAIAAAASRMLSQLGIWQKIAGEAQPINEMIVTDSKLRDAVRPVFLTFGGEATEGALKTAVQHVANMVTANSAEDEETAKKLNERIDAVESSMRSLRDR